MYNPPLHAIRDVAWMHDFIRCNAFATFAAIIEGAVHFAYVPVVLDEHPAPLGTVHFHLARSNPMAGLANGSIVKLSIMGAHAYISPDWYETPDLVPTWNYMAVEGSGPIERLDEADSVAYLTRLSAEQEASLAPKAPWLPSRLPPETLKRLLPGIVPFHLRLETLEGKAKLSQNRSQADIGGAIAALRQRGDDASAAVASAMQTLSVR